MTGKRIQVDRFHFSTQHFSTLRKQSNPNCARLRYMFAWEELGLRGDLIQGKDASIHKNYDACSEKGRQEILDKIKNSGCCETIFPGHQGRNKNPGGICSYPLGGGLDKPCGVFPNADFENKLATTMGSNCKEGCDVFQYSCGGNDPSNSAPGIQQGISNNLGCDFWATQRGDNYAIRKSGNLGDYKYNSFSPKDWQPDPRKRSWCVPFPMTRYKPEIKG